MNNYSNDKLVCGYSQSGRTNSMRLHPGLAGASATVPTGTLGPESVSTIRSCSQSVRYLGQSYLYIISSVLIRQAIIS